MKKQYADVIVDISSEKLDHPFTYRIPETLRQTVTAGSVVKIPFGRRSLQGYVVGFHETTDLDESRLKDILEVSAGCETADSRLIRLAAEMSRAYGSTMIQALKTVLPVRKDYRAVEKRTVMLADRGEAARALETAERRHHTAKARVLMKMLEDPERGIDASLLSKETSVPVSVIRKLEAEGILRIDTTESLRSVLKDVDAAGSDEPDEAQRAAVSAVFDEWEAKDRPVLLHGVTGSGKTVVYTELAEEMIRRGKQVIILVPEIALTQQTVSRFVRRFGNSVSFLHSRLSGGERYDQMRAARGGRISVMVGPRSALFTPFPNLGLIVIDEEQEDTYHSETVPRYDARDTAVMRAELEHAHVLFGTATPSVTAARRAERGEYLKISLRGRFGGQKLPETEIVDLRKELADGNRSILSRTLTDRMDETLRSHGQIMLFLNRRGYSGSWTCRSCGKSVRCPHCDVSMTYHRNGRLVCHYCGHETEAPERCPECGSTLIGGLSVGTEQVEEIVSAAFPAAKVLRMDGDTTKGKDGFEEILTSFAERKGDILIGTQMIVKGHDFPDVTLVGILCADLSLNEDHYRSSEHTFQLITQAAGRAGRGSRPGRAVIQTYSPEHFAVTSAAAQDFDAFYREEILYRRVLSYPPEGSMAAILGSAYSEELVDRGMYHIRRYIDRIDPEGRLHAIGPAPESIGKIRDRYRRVIYLRNASEENLILAKDRIEEYISMNSGFSKIQIQFDFHR